MEHSQCGGHKRGIVRCYCSVRDDIEVVWPDLKALQLAHQTFTDAADLDRAIHLPVQALNNERCRDPLVNRRISAWAAHKHPRSEMAGAPSALDIPLHADLGLLAQRRRGLLRDPHG